ncbi:MAG: acetoin utilization protein AcuC [Alphaproteobacteria bacterium]|nr:acetoin utilization protein AcuC [Alphaproteobacteria bacterium]
MKLSTSKRTILTHARPPLFVGSEIYRRPAYGKNHPLAIARVESAVDLARALGWLNDDVCKSEAADHSTLQRFHDSAYVAALHNADEQGHVSEEARRRFNLGTLENPVFRGVFERAATAVGGSILAAKLALEGRIAFHPAGGTHHAKANAASGFCYFNDPVFALLTLLDAGLKRVLYVDLDAHHGDGVEDAFAAEPRVFTISIHEAGRFPGTGTLGERREGRARNLPVPPGLNDSEFSFLIDEAVLPLAERFAPEAVVVTAGADPLAGDPLSKMALSNAALWNGVLRVADVAPAAVVLGGGGYNPWTLARFWAGLWGRIKGETIPVALPPAARAVLSPLSCDLIDDEDIDPMWLETLADPPNPGAVRAAILALRDDVLRA